EFLTAAARTRIVAPDLRVLALERLRLLRCLSARRLGAARPMINHTVILPVPASCWGRACRLWRVGRSGVRVPVRELLFFRFRAGRGLDLWLIRDLDRHQ